MRSFLLVMATAATTPLVACSSDTSAGSSGGVAAVQAGSAGMAEVTAGAGGSVLTAGRGGMAGLSAGSSGAGAAGTSAGGSSAGSSTGGTTSAGGGGTGGAGGTTSTPGCIGLFCEDFELGMVDVNKWDTQKSGGTFEVEQDLVAHGKYAVHFHGLDLATAKTQDYAFLISKNLPAELKTHHFGRASFFITPAPHSGHTGMFWAGTTGFPRPNYEEVANIGGGWQLGYVHNMSSPTDEKVAYPPGKVTAMKWQCMEWEFNDQPDMMSLWVESTLLGVFDDKHIDYPPGHVPGSPISNNMSSGLLGGFVDFGVGFYDWHPQNAFDLYYDDIVLDTKRVGCTGAGAP